MPPKKIKSKTKIVEAYDGFSAPISLLQKEFKARIAAAAIPEQNALPIIKTLEPPPEQPLTQIVVGDPVGSDCVRELCTVLHDLYYTKLRTVCFWNARIGDAGCTEVCNAIAYLPSLQKLEIQNCGFGSKSAAALSTSLRLYRNKSLRTISLAHNSSLTDDAVATLIHGISLNKGVRTVDLSFGSLTYKSGSLLAKLLEGPYSRLRTLNVEGNRLGSDGILALAKGLINSRTLEVVNMANNCTEVTHVEAMQAIAEVMVGNPTLIDIDIDGNLINDESVSILLSTVLKAKHVRKLILSHLVSPELVKLIEAELHTRKAPGKKSAKKGKKKAKK